MRGHCCGIRVPCCCYLFVWWCLAIRQRVGRFGPRRSQTRTRPRRLGILSPALVSCNGFRSRIGGVHCDARWFYSCPVRVSLAGVGDGPGCAFAGRRCLLGESFGIGATSPTRRGHAAPVFVARRVCYPSPPSPSVPKNRTLYSADHFAVAQAARCTPQTASLLLMASKCADPTSLSSFDGDDEVVVLNVGGALVFWAGNPVTAPRVA